jgi:hypothetical protein
MRHGAVILLSLSLFGCAAVFRGTKQTVTVESAPAGAEATSGPRKVGTTPARFEVERNGVTQVTVKKEGYEDSVGVVKKQMNPAWLTLDIVTCVVGCIPLLVDALTGGWIDVEARYVATLKPGVSSLVAAPSGSAVASGGPTVAPPATTTAPAAATVAMSESERKATARAAYLEGAKLQESGKCPEALPRFEAAQKLFSAPTHLLRIGQCQAATGKLVEAAETYETLVHMPLGKDAPEAFKTAQEDGKKELTQLRPRIPTLRVQLAPAPSSLSSIVVKLNGSTLPNEVIGIARPVNPGHYKVTVWAAGYREATEAVDVPEGTPRAVEVKLAK